MLYYLYGGIYLPSIIENYNSNVHKFFINFFYFMLKTFNIRPSNLKSLDYQGFLFHHYSLYPIEYRKFVMVVSILYMYIYFISRAYKNRVEHCISSVTPLCIFPLYINFMTNILGCYTKELDDFLLIG